MDIFVGFKSESSTWLVLTIVDGVGFMTSLPSRKKGRIMQILMGMWTIEIGLVYLATLVR